MRFSNTFRDRSLRKFWTLCALLFLFASSSQAGIELPPTRPIGRGQLSWILGVQKRIPWVLEGALSYSIDLYKLLAKEDDLVMDLKELPGYLDALKARGPLLEITIDIHEKKTVTAYRLSPKHVSLLRMAMASELSEVGKNPQIFLNRSTSRAQQALAYDPRNLLTGLILSLGNEAKSTLFPLPPSAQIQSLRKWIPKTGDTLPEGFAADLHGLNPQTRLSEALDIAQSRLELEAQLLDTLLTWALIVDQPEITLESLQTKPHTGNQLMELQDSDAMTSVLEQFARNYAPGREVQTIRRIKKLFSARIKEGSFAYTREVLEKVDQITLREATPSLAIFRGFVGADCGTSSSFGYAYSPDERTYFIYDKSGRLKGYLAGALVTRVGNRSPIFYLRDLSGPHLSPKVAKIALHGMADAVSKVGATSLVIADESRLEDNNHFPDIVSTLVAHSQGRSMSLKYSKIAEKARSLIANYVDSSNYDSVEDNSDALGFNPDPELMPRISTNVRAIADSDSRIVPQPVGEAELRRLLLSFMRSESQAGLNRSIAQELGIGFPNFDKNRSILNNEHRRSIDGWLIETQKVLNALGFKQTKTFIESNPQLYAYGYANARDAFSPHPKIPLSLSITFLKHLRDQGTWDLNRAGLISSFKRLRRSPEFPVYVRSLVRENESALTLLSIFVRIPEFDPEWMGDDVINRLTEIASRPLNEHSGDLYDEIANTAWSLLVSMAEKNHRYIPNVIEAFLNHTATYQQEFENDFYRAIKLVVRHGLNLEKTPELLNWVVDYQPTEEGVEPYLAAIGLAKLGERNSDIENLVDEFIEEQASYYDKVDYYLRQARQLRRSWRAADKQALAPESDPCQEALLNAA